MTSSTGHGPVTLGALNDLPAVIPVWHETEVSAASILGGMARSTAYDAALRGTIPTVRIGPGRVLVPTAVLLRMLGVEPVANGGEAA